MKKIFLFLMLTIPYLVQSQTYNNSNHHIGRYDVGTFFSTGSGYSSNEGISINTKIPANEEHNVTVYLKGYDRARTIGIQVSWYSDGKDVTRVSAASTGGWVPPITIDNSGGVMVIHLNDFTDEPNFEIVAFTDNDKNSGWFVDWNIENGANNSGREVVYVNKFSEVWTNNLYSEGMFTGQYGMFNGALGIGTTDFKGAFQVAANNRNYYVNRAIGGTTISAATAGVSTPVKGYLLLHQATGLMPVDDAFVMGRFSAVGTGSSNLKITSEINSASNGANNRASLVDYNESGATRLVTLNYEGMPYLAIEISHINALTDMSFTGYARAESLIFINEKIQVGHSSTYTNNTILSNVQPFVTASTDNVSFAGSIKLKTLPNAANDKVLSTDANGTVLLTNKNWITHSTPGATTSTIFHNGLVAIGSVTDLMQTTTTLNPSNYQLVVAGIIGAKRIKVTQGSWADYVFTKDYKLMPLTQLERFIKANGHLPEVPTTNDVHRDGVDIGTTQTLLLKKIEELTLHLIEQNKKIEKLEKEVSKLKKS